MNDLDPSLHGDDATRQVWSVEEACRQFVRHLVEGRPADVAAFLELVAPARRDELRERLEALSELLSSPSSSPPAATAKGSEDATVHVEAPSIQATQLPASGMDETVPRKADPTAGTREPSPASEDPPLQRRLRRSSAAIQARGSGGRRTQ